MLWGQQEIFGHVAGAFTGAGKRRPGLVEECSKGILCLDELNSASKEFQAAILRVSEQNSYKPVGADDEKKSDTLIIATTSGITNIRDDLCFRFDILPVPSLQKNDIPILVEHFFRKLHENVKVDTEMPMAVKQIYLDQFLNRAYPGNVRELKRECERLLVREGNKIFDKKGSSKRSSGNWIFNYDRYEREITTWNKHIQPLIDDHGPNDLKHKYMEWNPNWMDSNSEDRDISKENSAKRLVYGHYHNDPLKLSKTSSMYIHGTLELLTWLNHGAHEEKEHELPPLGGLKEQFLDDEVKELFSAGEERERSLSDLDGEEREQSLSDLDGEEKERFLKNEGIVVGTIGQFPKITPKDVVPFFRKQMREYFQKSVLPYLLQEIDRKVTITSTPPSAHSKPALSPLLDLPMNVAVAKFKISYMNYKLQKNDNDKSRAAEDSGLTIKAFEGRLNTVRKKLN